MKKYIISLAGDFVVLDESGMLDTSADYTFIDLTRDLDQPREICPICFRQTEHDDDVVWCNTCQIDWAEIDDLNFMFAGKRLVRQGKL